MKKRLTITGLAALVALIVACFAPLAVATDYYEVGITINGPGIIWNLDITNIPAITASDTIEVLYIDGSGEPHQITWTDIKIDADSMTLRFLPFDLPSKDVEVASSGVIVHYSNGDIATFSGPGFAWGRLSR